MLISSLFGLNKFNLLNCYLSTYFELHRCSYSLPLGSHQMVVIIWMDWIYKVVMLLLKTILLALVGQS